MFKLLAVFALIVSAVSAGYLGGYHAAPALAYAHAPVAVAHAPVATSYANSNSISLHATPVVAAHAPVAVAHAAPVVGLGYGIGHGYGLGHGLAFHH